MIGSIAGGRQLGDATQTANLGAGANYFPAAARSTLPRQRHFHYSINMNIELATLALKALAHDTRLRIFRRLVQAGPDGLCVADLAAHLATEANGSFSFHLKELSNAGLIRSRQVSRFIYYSANYPAMNELLGFLTEHCCAGEPCGEQSHQCTTTELQ